MCQNNAATTPHPVLPSPSSSLGVGSRQTILTWTMKTNDKVTARKNALPAANVIWARR